MSTYVFIIAGATIVILSYLFNLVAKRYNIPSVLLLIGTGIGLKQLMKALDTGKIDWFPVLEVLGIIGLIMIVLEAALDLKLEKSKIGLITRSLIVALIGLLASSFIAAMILQLFIQEFDLLGAMIYAVPLSIISSAIVIPSVENLSQEKKEFSVYESTFSDILGILLFYFLLNLAGPGTQSEAVGGFVLSLLLTVGISLVAGYVLIYVFQNIKTPVKMFLLIAILILLYSIGKMFHLSSLIMILIFGLMIANSKLFFPKFTARFIQPNAVTRLLEDLHLVTLETAFIVRTFFFVIFGITLVLSSLLSVTVLLTSALILLSIFGIRLALFKVFLGREIFPEVYIAPRGLITVLLFFAIPRELQEPAFDSGILLFIIISTALVMTWAMIRAAKKSTEEKVLDMMRAEDAGAGDPKNNGDSDQLESKEPQ